MNKILIGAIIVLVVGVGAFFLLNRGEQMMDKSAGDSIESGENSEKMTVEGYQGNVLAGSTSPFIEFNKSDYEKAKSEGKIILLDFYASWCPICRAEAPEINAGFNELNNPNVIGFRVNFNDPDTDADEKNLATEFKIPYQHTKVIIKNGQEVSRSTDQWTKDDLIEAVNNAQ